MPISGQRRSYSRQAGDDRREALIAATLDILAQQGAGAATVRAIAERAGVTGGLIRHYFSTKDELTHAAYRRLMQRMTDESSAVVARAPPDPVARLAAFVRASLSAPVVDGGRFSLWAGFIAQVSRDAGLRAVHRDSYLHYRDVLQGLIAALPGSPDLATARRWSIASNAVIDGLWIEGCALPEAFENGELARLGLATVGAIVGQDLAAVEGAA